MSLYLVEDREDATRPYLFHDVEDFTGDNWQENFGKVMVVNFKPTHEIRRPLPPPEYQLIPLKTARKRPAKRRTR